MVKPEPSSRHPLIVFLLLLCALAGSGPLLGATPAPGSLNAIAPANCVKVWAFFLTAGALLFLVGIASQPRHLVSGVLMERVAAFMLAGAGIIYGTAVLGAAGPSALLPAGLVITLGVACLYRWYTLGRQIRAAKRSM